MWDITAAGLADPDYPLPWADQPELTHLATSNRLRAAVESAGFAVEHWNDLTTRRPRRCRCSWRYRLTRSDCMPSLPEFAEKAQNLTRALTDGRLWAVQAVARAVDRRP
jgi:sarcosine/dimethylglycine N-methyltransferase